MYNLSGFRSFFVRYYRNNSDIKPIFHFWHYQTARSRQRTNQNANPHRPNSRSGPLVLVKTIVTTSIQLLVLTRFTSVLTASANTAQISLQPNYSRVSDRVNNNLLSQHPRQRHNLLLANNCHPSVRGGPSSTTPGHARHLFSQVCQFLLCYTNDFLIQCTLHGSFLCRRLCLYRI